MASPTKQRIGKYFFIRCQGNPRLVVAIQDGIDRPAAPLVTAEARAEHDSNDHQLWYYDKVTTTIRNRLNAFCMDLKSKENGMTVVLNLIGWSCS